MFTPVFLDLRPPLSGVKVDTRVKVKYTGASSSSRCTRSPIEREVLGFNGPRAYLALKFRFSCGSSMCDSSSLGAIHRQGKNNIPVSIDKNRGNLIRENYISGEIFLMAWERKRYFKSRGIHRDPAIDIRVFTFKARAPGCTLKSLPPAQACIYAQECITYMCVTREKFILLHGEQIIFWTFDLFFQRNTAAYRSAKINACRTLAHKSDSV